MTMGYTAVRRAGVVHVLDRVDDHRTYWLCGGSTWKPVLGEDLRGEGGRDDCVRCFELAATERSFVYFARARGLIKIGCSAVPGQRARALGAELLATRPGSYVVEAVLHEVFAEDREYGEWFRQSSTLLGYIDRLSKLEAAA